ncbi:bifunctional DNA-formamidopyrimidine glycosylase/DNA-(apurinic or apyrimidinic site) lyase [Mesorhizobium sp. DCY119]|jgi:formamidopyrimidine-DNA glycosylase|uniref:bifunctional DNA-formamidopyrimidine glycosylase/DNA-(apurinic or apyrimidinic site) lyase n=1 Tax=Mesorhizobium sp. DCY119 TaxID=2108445 RepID=UPI000E6CBE94|nr:bifunctional DNA-formamidopyrimidine glycosylase/DNA-(apurinic or apyrimidinic site) lyase [Mesorhizobium sp. DCY119]RJG46956.1 bifunctional DNA-formamidopyrimidine glycosylase/DNA-(apurinic or apyrimidinic site) lyase [Mesorhizobium sp. DCY119]
MPELPEVETVRRGLQPVLEGARIVSVETRRPNLRYPFPERFAERLQGRRVTALGRRAKYLTAHIEDGPVLICHLGMSGSFRIEADGALDTPGVFHHERSKASAHDHVVFNLTTSKGAPARIVFNDPRRFGFMLFAEGLAEDHPMLAGLGVEPTGNALDGKLLADLFRDKKTPLKAALLDQRLIAGLGNIYVSEALWRAGLSPLRAAGTIAVRGKKAAETSEKLADAIRSVIADAIAAGGSSLRDYVHTDGSLGYFQHSFSVYDREGVACPTPGCAGHIERVVQSGRSTFYCPSCQR